MERLRVRDIISSADAQGPAPCALPELLLDDDLTPRMLAALDLLRTTATPRAPEATSAPIAPGLLTLDGDTAITAAATLMLRHRARAALIMIDQRPAGLLTDRELSRAMVRYARQVTRDYRLCAGRRRPRGG